MTEGVGPAPELEKALGPVLGEPVEITAVTRLSGGASRETWAFTATPPGGSPRELILRRDPPGRPGEEGAMRREADAMRAAGRAGLPAPEIVMDDQEGALGTAGLVMGRVAGETIARRILRDDEYRGARAVLAGQCGRFLAGLHAIDPAEVPGLEQADALTRNRERYVELGFVSPTFETAFRWLDAHRPDPAGVVVVHGDFRLGNLIVGEDGLRAAIDWEIVHLGDPLEDLGWLCVKAWRFRERLPVGGFGTIDELVAAYEAGSGREVDRGALHWWLVLNTLKWGIGCAGQAAAHLTGLQRSVELAAIGRRVAEQEWDLVELLAPEATAAALSDADTATVEPPPVSQLHRHPTADELLEALGEFLTGDVFGATEGRIQFHTRVAGNVVATVRRELALGPAQEAAYREALASVGVDSDADLARAVAAGELDDRLDALHAVLAASTRDKLLVYNPRHLKI